MSFPFLKTSAMISLGLLFQGQMVCGQTVAPISRTGVEAADALKDERLLQKNDYNLKLGTMEFRFDGGLRQEYNDNIGLTENSKQDDFITSPHVGMEVDWPLSQLNGLNLKLDLAYAKYWNHPELDSTTILITPGSLLDFNIFVHDIHFNVHDRLAIQQDPTAVPQLSNLATFRRLTNTAGASMEWDLNKVLVQGGFDHDTFTSLESRFDTLNHATDTVYTKVGCRVSEPWVVGVTGSYTMTEYDKAFQNGSTGYSGGVFADVVISEYLRGSGDVRFQQSNYDRGGAILDNQDFQSMVFSFSLQNQLNRFINQTAEIHRSAEAGIGSNFTDVYQANYKIAGEFIRNISSSLTFFVEHFEDSQSITSERGFRYGISPQLEYQLFERTRLALGYQRTVKDSQLALDYEQNRFFIDVSHRF